MDDSNIIALILAGDRSAFPLLMDRYMHMVHTVAYRVLRNEMDAEEVTQDVFVKVYQRLGEFKGQGKFSTWLYSIAYRMAISALRGRKKTTGSLEELSALGKEPAAAMADPIYERAAILDKALRTLTPEDAAVMTMFYLEEFSIEEIVTVTGIGASNVKVKLHRCRKRLHEVLQQQLKGETWTLMTSA
ncbi:MAG: RNA polymerase sigma factor [Flavobacteriales bacterium]